MFWERTRNVIETFLLRAQNIYLIEEKTDNNYVWGSYVFMSTSL